MSNLASSIDNQVAFANVLNELGYLPDTEATIYFFEKPYKWEREFEMWDYYNQPWADSENWSAFSEWMEENVR